MGEASPGPVAPGSKDHPGQNYFVLSTRWEKPGERNRPKKRFGTRFKSVSEIEHREVASHDLRTCARLYHAAGGELEQIQFRLGQVSIQTTERYLGCKQRIRGAVNDKIGIDPAD